MPSVTVQRNLRREEGKGHGDKAMLRCPHCDQHFYHGGDVSDVSPESGAHEFDREHEEEMGLADRARKYDREYDHYYGAGEASDADEIRHGYASGGRVDGSGKVDGVHRHPSECSHLAAGGVCRHLAPSRRRPPGEDYADSKPRNFAGGGSVPSFTGYLAKRHAARKGGL